MEARGRCECWQTSCPGTWRELPQEAMPSLQGPQVPCGPVVGDPIGPALTCPALVPSA